VFSDIPTAFTTEVTVTKMFAETDCALDWYWGGISTHIDVMVHRIHVTLCDAATNIVAPEVGELLGCSADHPPPPFPRAKKKKKSW